MSACPRTWWLALCIVACTPETEPDDPTDPTDTTDPVDTEDTDTVTMPTGDTGDTAPLLAKTDNDTLDDPLFTVSFLGSGAPDTFTMDDDISAAPGDPEDWVQFTTPAPNNPDVSMTFELTCTGTDSIVAELWDVEGSSPTRLNAQVSCLASPRSHLLDVSRDFAARVHYPQGAEVGDYTAWTLTIRY